MAGTRLHDAAFAVVAGALSTPARRFSRNTSAKIFANQHQADRSRS